MIDPLRQRARAHEPMRGDLRGLLSGPYHGIKFSGSSRYVDATKPGFGREASDRGVVDRGRVIFGIGDWVGYLQPLQTEGNELKGMSWIEECGISRQPRRLLPEATLSRLFRGSGFAEGPFFPKAVEDTAGSDIPLGVLTPRGILARGERFFISSPPVYLVTFSLAVSGCLDLRVP